MFPRDTKAQELLKLYDVSDPHPRIGTLLNKTKCALIAVYDFAVLGGAIGTVGLLDDQGEPAVLPKGALVDHVLVNVVTQPTSLGSATVALGSGIASATDDLLAATAKASLPVGLLDGVPDGTAAKVVGPVTEGGDGYDAGSQVTATIAAAALTHGKIYVNIEYYINPLT